MDKRHRYCTFLLLYFSLGISLHAQHWQSERRAHANPAITSQAWDAVWISHPTASLTAHGVFYFRKIFEMSSVPDAFIVHVSADNRYELYVNGQRVTLGPAWGDLQHWRFESLDIAPYLVAGENIIVAQVVNFGHLRAVSQLSYKTGFILQGNSEREAFLNTHPDGWEVLQDQAYRPIKVDWRTIIGGYYAANPTDTFRAEQHYWQWKEPQNDYPWLRPEQPEMTARGTPRQAGHEFSDQSPWLLVPRNIPLLEETQQYLAEIARSEGVIVDSAFLRGGAPLKIPANTKATILLDHTVHTRGFPEFFFSGGQNATIRVTYTEALVDSAQQKGNRDVVAGKKAVGYYDVILPDGGEQRSYRPLWYRVFRYMELAIETQNQPLTLDSLQFLYTAYPYHLSAHFETDNPQHEQLFTMGGRTLRNGTAEVFEDGPYYEQLMYAGDARIESLVSLYMSGDERMTKNAISLFNSSRIPEGLTYARYPSNIPQINPQYSLAWIQTIHDFMRYSADTTFAQQYLDGIAAVLGWHTKLVDSTGMLGEVPWLKHIENKSRTPRHPERGHSAQQTLFLALTLDMAANIFRFYGFAEQADQYADQAKQLKQATYRWCWDEQRGLLGDTPEQDVYTQHANVLGILTDAIPPERHRPVMQQVLSDTSLVQALLFFRFWTFQALDKSGLGDEFLQNIGLWELMLDYGLTTFPELGVESRSDCHPWSTHVNYFFLSTVAGIKSEGFGFDQIVIEPHPGEQRYVEARMPHHRGTIAVTIDRRKKKHYARIILPEGLTGTFRWNGKEQPLRSGEQEIPYE